MTYRMLRRKIPQSFSTLPSRGRRWCIFLKRNWLDDLPYRLDDSLTQRCDCLWLLYQAGKDEEGRIREALLSVLVVHTTLPAID